MQPSAQCGENCDETLPTTDTRDVHIVPRTCTQKCALVTQCGKNFNETLPTAGAKSISTIQQHYRAMRMKTKSKTKNVRNAKEQSCAAEQQKSALLWDK